MASGLWRPCAAWTAVLVLHVGACQRVQREPPPKPDAVKSSASAPEVSRVLELMERRRRFYMIADTHEGPTCRPWRFERSKIASWTAAGVPNFVQELGPGPSWLPVRLRVEKQKERILVSDPRVIVNGDEVTGIGATLGSCTRDEEGTACDGLIGPQSLTPASLDGETIEMKEGNRWYLDEKACQAALPGHRKSDPTLCSPVVSRYPGGVEIEPVPEAFRQIFIGRGNLVRKGISRAGAPVCEPWSVRTTAGRRQELAYVERVKDGCFEYLFKRSVQIELLGNSMAWGGPSGEFVRTIHDCPGHGGIGGGTIGCRDYLPVTGQAPDRVAIGRDQIFYLDRAACESDLRAAAPAQRR